MLTKIEQKFISIITDILPSKDLNELMIRIKKYEI